MNHTIEMTGQRFGKLVVGSYAGIKNNAATFQCVCDCGKTKIVRGGHLREGKTTSCGCFLSAQSRARAYKHGNSRRTGEWSLAYRSWVCAKNRCFDPNNINYRNYGGRGITMCDRWTNSFKNFLEDMGDRLPGLSLDRIDCNGNYEPGNCRWATIQEQSKNRRKPQQTSGVAVHQ